MTNIYDLRQQLKGTSERSGREFPIRAIEQVLPPATARRFLYEQDYDPSLTTIKKLVDAKFLIVNFPLVPATYAQLLKECTNDELRAIARNSEGVLRYNTLRQMRSKSVSRMRLSTAVAIREGVQTVKN